jgi:hypothetical protein
VNVPGRDLVLMISTPWRLALESGQPASYCPWLLRLDPIEFGNADGWVSGGIS